MAVQEQAAQIVAVLGLTALEIIADVRAQRWTLIAARRKDPVYAELATVRAGEWLRIAHRT